MANHFLSSTGELYELIAERRLIGRNLDGWLVGLFHVRKTVNKFFRRDHACDDVGKC